MPLKGFELWRMGDVLSTPPVGDGVGLEVPGSAVELGTRQFLQGSLC